MRGNILKQATTSPSESLPTHDSLSYSHAIRRYVTSPVETATLNNLRMNQHDFHFHDIFQPIQANPGVITSNKQRLPPSQSSATHHS